MIQNYIQHVLHPEWYHGSHKKAPYFEGWYFKCVSADERHKWAFIPGIFKNKDESKTHAFIQVLNGQTGEAFYHKFDDLIATPNDFKVHLGNNHFQLDTISFDIADEIGTIQGQLKFSDLHPWPVSIKEPGVMGWYGWLPILECYHGVCSLDHQIEGTLTIYGEVVNFSGGRGYIEKDWGQSFPTGYVWQQSNHFDTVGTSLTASIASIPNLGQTFAGFIVGLWHEGELYRFTTYNGSHVKRLHVSDTHVEWVLANSRYELEIVSERAEGGLLLGPEREDMHKRVDETMQATVHVKLYGLSGVKKTLKFEETGRNAALEVVGDLGLVLKA